MAVSAQLTAFLTVSGQVKGGSQCCFVAIQVNNYAHIAAAFGVGVADNMVNEIRQRLNRLLSAEVVVLVPTDGRIFAVILDSEVLELPQNRSEEDDVAEALLTAMGTLSVEHEGVAIYATLTAVAVKTERSELDEDIDPLRIALRKLQRVRFGGAAVGAVSNWADLYRRDMAEVDAVYRAVHEDGLAIAWQAICDVTSSGRVLYHEALLRMAAHSGERKSAALLFPTLERLGLTRVLDRHVVHLVIEELEAHPDICLGVNISAQSACLDSWWMSASARLRARPDVARRLIIEITESAAFPSLSDAVKFARHMRRLGCRIAIDDFGTGHASLRHLIALAPDIIKVDAFFVKQARLSDQGKALLGHLINFARSLAVEVIVEGAETADESELIANAGAIWLQGYFHGCPSIVRSWTAAVPSYEF